MEVLEKIEKLRKEKGWSINYLAMESGLTQSTLNNLYSRNTEPKISTLRAICSAFGITLSDFFKDEENIKEIDRLFEVGVKIKAPDQLKSSKLQGFTFVLTGTLPNYSRPDMTKLIEENGGKTASSVSKNTSFVIAGEDAGSKFDKAKALGVVVLSEQEFFDKFLVK